ncbi:MAG: hypothetical protein P8X74_04710 [Reinekea sp.]
MLPKNFNEPMGAPAIFEKQIEINGLHPASTMESRIQVYPFHKTARMFLSGPFCLWCLSNVTSKTNLDSSFTLNVSHFTSFNAKKAPVFSSELCL